MRPPTSSPDELRALLQSTAILRPLSDGVVESNTPARQTAPPCGGGRQAAGSRRVADVKFDAPDKHWSRRTPHPPPTVPGAPLRRGRPDRSPSACPCHRRPKPP